MADNNTPIGDSTEKVSAALQPDDGAVIPRISLKEVGFSAIKMTSMGQIVEEAQQQFRYPNLLKVVAEMKYSPPVQIGLQAINTLMNRSEVVVLPLVDETPQDKERREFLYSVLHDMDNTWQSTMQSISTYKEYGFQISEMVFRRRLKRNGSKYDDGLVGVRGLRNRPQNSIRYWNFALDGRELLSVSQTLQNNPNNARFAQLFNEQGCIEIPREKFILFRCDPTDDNPEGNSCLKSAYLAWKQLTLISDNMMVGISKDIAGIPYVKLDPRYMAPDAKPEDAAVFAAVKAIVDNVATGQQAGIVFPSLIDENGNDKFSFSLLEQKSGKAYDIPAIIAMLQANILSVLSASSVSMSAADGGSLSLQDSATNMLSLTVSYRLSEIANTLNKEFVPRLWELNGWGTDRLPSIGFKDVSSVSLEEFSKFFQRVAAVGGIEYTRDVLNKVREIGGFQQLPDDLEVDPEKLSTGMTGKETGSGEGLSVGSNGDGTSKAPTKHDNSAANSENKG